VELNKQKKNVSLALGGGGAKSFAHLGVIEVLQENNISIDHLATCSGGSIIGALIACGVSIEEIRSEFYQTVKKVNWLRPRVNGKGFFSQQNVITILSKFCKEKKIEDLEIPISIVSTNLNNGKLKVFTDGNLIEAVCASSAFPGIYQPVEIDKQLYIDGGILNSIPADISRKEMGNNGIVISISLDEKLNENIDKNNTLSIVHRSIYIPLIANRQKIINENSDIKINVFADHDFTFSNWRDALRFYSEAKMECFYIKGKEAAVKRIDEIKKLIDK
jgi:NTE family protein